MKLRHFIFIAALWLIGNVARAELTIGDTTLTGTFDSTGGAPEINPTSLIGAFIVLGGGALLVWETMRRRARKA